MKVCIIVATKEGQYIEQMLNSTNLLSFEHDLYIVDGNSSDQSYFSLAREYGTLIEGNSNYELGALWKALDTIQDKSIYSHYMLMQDSMFFNEDLDIDFSEELVYAFKHFKGWEQANEYWTMPEAQVFRKESGIDISNNDFIMFQSSLFLCSYENLLKLIDVKLRTFIPKNKKGSMCSERIIGIAFKSIKANVSNVQLNNFIGKTFAKRQ